jgi:hypothetical protein
LARRPGPSEVAARGRGRPTPAHLLLRRTRTML